MLNSFIKKNPTLLCRERCFIFSALLVVHTFAKCICILNINLIKCLALRTMARISLTW